MDNISVIKKQMTLGRAWKIYLFCMLVISWILQSDALAKTNYKGEIFFITYFIIGVYLNRKVLRELISWHPVYNTLENVVKSKLYGLFFWPLSYFYLLISFTINKAI